MIVVKLSGGLGNQMFQYAVAYAQKQKVFIDVRHFRLSDPAAESFTKRDFELDLFPRLKYKKYNLIWRILFRISCLFQDLTSRENFSFLVEETTSDNIHIPKRRNLFFNGFFQSERYFTHLRKEILDVFQFPELDPINASVAKQIATTPHSVALHIRRGDYLTPEGLKIHGVQPLEYYMKALEMVKEQIFPSEMRVVIFSDDPKYARQNFQHLENVIFVAGNENAAWKDMALMSHCRHHIIANSSFSWWGAWLSRQSDSINIAPKNWFNPDVAKFDISVFIPDSWFVL